MITRSLELGYSTSGAFYHDVRIRVMVVFFTFFFPVRPKHPTSCSHVVLGGFAQLYSIPGSCCQTLKYYYYVYNLWLVVFALNMNILLYYIMMYMCIIQYNIINMRARAIELIRELQKCISAECAAPATSHPSSCRSGPSAFAVLISL